MQDGVPQGPGLGTTRMQWLQSGIERHKCLVTMVMAAAVTFFSSPYTFKFLHENVLFFLDHHKTDVFFYYFICNV